MTVISVVLVYGCFIAAQSTASPHWDYKDIAGWAKNFPTCGKGTSQSPIDIIKKDAVSKHGESPELKINSGVSATGTLKNNGHAVQLDLAAGRYSLSAGNLGGTYLIDQVHFHWGSIFSPGSEHRIDGKGYPVEMHVVSHRNNYASLTAAIDSNNENALAVFGFLFNMAWKDNKKLDPITENLSHIPSTGAETNVGNFDLHALIKDALKEPFYRYNGSLTTPPCSEVVQWTVFKKKLGLSLSQLVGFRGTGIDGNFRPTQPMHGRRVEKMGN